MEPTLNDLAFKYGTDKSSAFHGYCQIYDQLLTPLRHEPVKLLELGVANGASIRMWDEYFDHPEAIIAGIDKDLGTKEILGNHGYAGGYQPLNQRYGPPVPGVVTYLGDQAKVPHGLKGWVPDIIIDDASHLSTKTIASFHTWFPILKSGGIYVVEDVATSYDVTYWDESETSSDPDVPPRMGSQTTMQFLRRLADQVHAYAWARTLRDEYLLDFEVAAICFYPNLVVVSKQDDRPYTEVRQYGSMYQAQTSPIMKYSLDSDGKAQPLVPE
jgi:hypothetical protein